MELAGQEARANPEHENYILRTPTDHKSIAAVAARSHVSPVPVPLYRVNQDLCPSVSVSHAHDKKVERITTERASGTKKPVTPLVLMYALNRRRAK